MVRPEHLLEPVFRPLHVSGIGGRHAGVGNEDVEAIVLGAEGSREGADRGEARDVEVHEDTARLLRRLCALALISAREHHRRLLLGELLGGGVPRAGVRTCDDDHLAGRPCSDQRLGE